MKWNVVWSDDLFMLQLEYKNFGEREKICFEIITECQPASDCQHFLLLRTVVEHMDICMPSCKHFAASYQIFMSIMGKFNWECFAEINEYWISA